MILMSSRPKMNTYRPRNALDMTYINGKVMGATDFAATLTALLTFRRMIAVATLMALINQVSGTPYISGGDSPRGTDCSGLASWVSNVATGRPAFGDRFNTGNQERALLARGFRYGSAPGALNIGWNGGHTAVTLPDGTPVSSGEGGGVRIGGEGAYQRQFSRHMYLPVAIDEINDPAAPFDPATAPVDPFAPAPAPEPVALPDPAAVPADALLPPPAPFPAPMDAPEVIPVGAELPPPPMPEPLPEPTVVNADMVLPAPDTAPPMGI